MASSASSDVRLPDMPRKSTTKLEGLLLDVNKKLKPSPLVASSPARLGHFNSVHSPGIQTHRFDSKIETVQLDFPAPQFRENKGKVQLGIFVGVGKMQKTASYVPIIRQRESTTMLANASRPDDELHPETDVETNLWNYSPLISSASEEDIMEAVHSEGS